MLTDYLSLFWFLTSLPSESKLVGSYSFLSLTVVWSFSDYGRYWCREVGTDPERVMRYFVLIFQKRIFIGIYCAWINKFSYWYIQKDLRSAWANEKYRVGFCKINCTSIFSLLIYTERDSWNWIPLFLTLHTLGSFLFLIKIVTSEIALNFTKKMFVTNCCIWQ